MAAPTGGGSCEERGGAPSLTGPDLIALSFVYGLPRDWLFPMLRGEEIPLDSRSRRRLPPGVESGGVGRNLLPYVPANTLEELLAALGVSDPATSAEKARKTAFRALDRAHERGVDVVSWLDARYPPLLARIFDPPLVLWVRGSVAVLADRAVAVVGSRMASVYGEDTARRLGSDLATRDVVVVSGLARGIDAAAHRGALAAGGRTIAVLGCGPDVVYPPEHAALTEEILGSGAVVSELAPGTAPLSMHFPRRNRIISGLSLGVVVVEARQRSGALITADCALEQGREVMAVPGNVLSDRHRGSHTLLKAGAGLVETADDVLHTLTLAGAPVQPSRPRQEDPLLAAMDAGEIYGLDDLARALGRDAAALLPRLLELELQGLLRRVPGGRFVRSGGTC